MAIIMTNNLTWRENEMPIFSNKATKDNCIMILKNTFTICMAEDAKSNGIRITLNSTNQEGDHKTSKFPELLENVIWILEDFKMVDSIMELT